MSMRNQIEWRSSHMAGSRVLYRRLHHHAFSLLEIMIVVAIIAMLVALVTVVAGRLRGTAERTSTLNLMSAIESGLEQFKADIGYYPPLLTDDLTIPDFPTRRDNYDNRRDLRYYSTLTLVPYLEGVGNLNRSEGTLEQEAGDEEDDGYAGDGFLDPSPDKSWGGALNAEERVDYFVEKREKQGGKLKGRVYGPYIELGSKYDVSPAVDRNGEPFNEGSDPIEGLYQFNDWWEQPIRYYRGWQKDPDWEYDQDLFSADYLAEWIPSIPVAQRENFSVSLRSAPYVLFSSGKDAQSQPDREEEDYEKMNKDNIVEVGS